MMRLKNTVAVRRGLNTILLFAQSDIEVAMSDEPPRFNAKEYADIQKAINWLKQAMTEPTKQNKGKS